jgi:hypothetical protein
MRSVMESVIVESGAYDAAAMAAGEPGLPRAFTWRGRRFVVARALDTRRETEPCRHGSRERYVRRHVTRVTTECGCTAVLSGERGAGTGPRWILRTLEEPGAA